MPYRTPPEAPRSLAPRGARVDWSGLARALVAWGVAVGLFLTGDAKGSQALLSASLVASVVAGALTYATIYFTWPGHVRARTVVAVAITAALVGMGHHTSSALWYALAGPAGMTAIICLLVLYIARSNARHTARAKARFRELGYVPCPRCGRHEPPPIDLARCHGCGAAIPENGANGTGCICGECYAEHWKSSG